MNGNNLLYALCVELTSNWRRWCHLDVKISQGWRPSGLTANDCCKVRTCPWRTDWNQYSDLFVSVGGRSICLPGTRGVFRLWFLFVVWTLPCRFHDGSFHGSVPMPIKTTTQSNPYMWNIDRIVLLAECSVDNTLRAGVSEFYEVDGDVLFAVGDLVGRWKHTEGAELAFATFCWTRPAFLLINVIWTTWFLIALGRLNATRGFNGKISLSTGSFSMTWRLFFNIEGIELTAEGGLPITDEDDVWIFFFLL